MTFQGQTTALPLGIGGQFGGRNISRVPVGSFIYTKNIDLSTGNVSKEGGNILYGTLPAGTAARVGWDWWPTTATQRMVVAAQDGKLYKDSGAGTFAVTLKSGLAVSVSDPGQFVEGGAEVLANNKKLFYFSAGNAVQVLSADGATTSDLATPPADWATKHPIAGAIHEARLWGFAGHRAYWSTAASHEDFTGAGSGSISIFSGEGDELVHGVSFKGLLVVFKRPTGVYYIDTTDSDITKWRVVKVTRGTGAAGVQAVFETSNDIMYMDPNGTLRLLSTTQAFGNVRSDSIDPQDQMDQWVRDNINLSQVPYVRGIYYEAKAEAHFGMAPAGSAIRTTRLVLDSNGQLPRFRVSYKDDNAALWLRKKSDGVIRPVNGGSDGKVYLLDDPTTKAKDGVAYEALFQTNYYDLGHIDPALATIRKNGAFLEVVGEATGGATFSVDVYWDGKYSETLNFIMGFPGGAVLGTTFVLGTAVLGISGGIVNKRKRLSGGGKRISLVGRNAVANEDFSIAGIFLEWTPADDREAE